MKETEVAIIGGGPVGIYCAFNVALLGLNTTIIESNERPGGQCEYLYPEKNIYDIPAFERIKAKDLISNLLKQQEKLSSKIQYITNCKVLKIEKEEDVFYLENQKGERFLKAKSVILATGVGCFEPNKIPLAEVDEFENKFLFYSVKDPLKFKDKNIAILGGGDSALDWCFELSDIAKKIYLIHRRDSFRSNQYNLERINHLIQLNKLEIITPFKLKSLKQRSEEIINIEINSISSEEEKIEIECNYILAFFGLRNDNSLMKNSNIETKFNSVLVDNSMQTNIKGVFCIGDAVNYENKLKLIMSGFSESAIASHSVYKYINKKMPILQHSTSIFN